MFKKLLKKNKSVSTPDPAVQELTRNINKALLNKACVIFTTTLIQGENGEDDRLDHSMYFGAGFKIDDLTGTLEAYKGLVEDRLKAKSDEEAVAKKGGAVVDEVK